MFDHMKGMMEQFQMMQELMKDENFRNFIAHPKVQTLFQDPEFKETAQTRDFSKIVSHPKFMTLTQDPEVAALLMKIDAQKFMKRS